MSRFQEHSNEYPWTWSPHHFDEFMADRRSGERQFALSTLRANAGAVRAFCSYVTEARYGWVPFCEQMFGNVPAQVVFDWNAPRHSTDDAVPPRRRSLTMYELQAFFDAADDIVDEEFAKGSKRWLPALRDSIAFKVAYASGLRRRELTMLEYVDFGPNPKVPDYHRFGSVQVRWAKGTRGSGPGRRTVLTAPEFDWVVPLLEFWLSPAGRERFPTADRSALMRPSERVRRIGPAQLRPSLPADPAPRRTAGGTHDARAEALVRDAPDRGRLRPAVRAAAGWTRVLLHDGAVHTSVSSDFKQKTVQRMIARRIRTGDTSDGSGS